jgi:hypothetical protein
MPGVSYQVEAPTSSSSPAPRPSPLPIHANSRAGQTTSSSQTNPSSSEKEEEEGELQEQSTPFDLPKLRLEIRDLTHPGATIFFGAVNISSCFEAAVRNVLKWLYTSPTNPHTHAPATRSVTLILRDMGGVAYTTGTDLDDDHKEIHFNLGYIAGIAPEQHASEITGVLTHELVHCYQWDGLHTAPGGLIEGIADWVRLNCDLAPPHWSRDTSGSWDGGYQHTAYFLDYLEKRFGQGSVRRINETMRAGKYEEKPFWTGLLGRPVEQLWEDYKKSEGDKGGEASKAGETVDEATQT